MILKYYDNSNIDNKDVKFILKDDGLHYDNSLISWNDIIKVLKIDDDKQEFLNLMKKQGKL